MTVSLLMPEDLIVSKLKKTVPEFLDVLCAEDIFSAVKNTRRAPAAHVIYMGYKPTQSVRSGAKQEIETYWMIVVVVHCVRTPESGKAARKIADPLITKTFGALLGVRLNPSLTPLKLEPAPHADFGKTFAYFPLKFSTRVTMCGTI